MINAYTVRGGHIVLRDGEDVVIRTADGREVGVMFWKGEFSFTIAHNPPPDGGHTYDATGPRVACANESGWHVEA